eukprot:gene8910-9086_t
MLGGRLCDVPRAKARYPHCHFERLDGFDIHKLKELSPNRTFDKIFIDIGGIAELHIVMSLAPVKPQSIFRKDYTPPPYLISTVDLNFVLNEDVTHVTSKLQLVPNYEPNGAAPPLFLNGRDDVKLVGVKVAGAPVPETGYKLTEKSLTLLSPPAGPFELEVTTAIKPQDNSLLEGLYKSGGNFSTQCEAEGFRGITYFLDRPDVMARYTTRLEADKAKYPVLLSNGNLKSSGDLEGGRHFAVWEDPFPKPCYLFALVAGDLMVKEDSYTTSSGRNVTLRIYTQPANINQVNHAMESLKKSMKWDEDVYGLEYDLVGPAPWSSGLPKGCWDCLTDAPQVLFCYWCYWCHPLGLTGLRLGVGLPTLN